MIIIVRKFTNLSWCMAERSIIELVTSVLHHFSHAMVEPLNSGKKPVLIVLVPDSTVGLENVLEDKTQL